MANAIPAPIIVNILVESFVYASRRFVPLPATRVSLNILETCDPNHRRKHGKHIINIVSRVEISHSYSASIFDMGI